MVRSTPRFAQERSRAIAPRHSARSGRERTQRSPARPLALENRPPPSARRAPAPRRPSPSEGRSGDARPADGRPRTSRPVSDARSPSSALVRREPPGRPVRRPATRRSRWRTGPALLLSLGVLLAMGAVLLVFSGGSDNSAPAAAAPAAAPAAAAIHPAAPSGPVALTPAELAKCPAGTTACVDLAAHTAWLQGDGKVIGGPVEMLPGADTFKRPPGPTSSATPTGTFHVLRKDKDGYSTEFDEPMHHAVYFAPGGIAFHEGSLTTSSNGCIHLSAADAATFFDALRIGDGVTVF